MSNPSQVESIFFAALEKKSAAERAVYLDQACGDDEALRRRVEQLLDAHPKAADFLAQPAVDRREFESIDAAEDLAGLAPTDGSEAIPGDPMARTVLSEPTLPETLPGTVTYASETIPGTELCTGAAGPDGTVPTIAGAPPPPRPGGFVPGQIIAGRYTLREVLGEGGMGAVYRAEQSQPVKRQVALKLIKLGMDSRAVLARFDAERQALALMDHPNIARVYDGGATEANQPFFVMELVNGVSITDYCDQHRLPLRARLELFVAVCQAVQHAHQKGIIHRDLKPGNVLVTEVDGRPTPKVIDFGVAKATKFDLTDQSLADTGAVVGTPEYMSPEQADPSSMDIDTRTDVYALGVILYELLAGSPPLDAKQFKRGAILEMLRMVREVDPPRPSTKVSTSDALPNIAARRAIDPADLKRALRGDLDWIVMKALEKDRTRRYETANGFAADVMRHLANEPVVAAPPSRSYQLRKFVRKHRAGVIAASLVLLALVAGVAGTTWGLFEARRAADAERLARLDAQENEKKAVAAAEGERLAKIDAQENEKKAVAAAEGERLAKIDAQNKKRLAEENEKKALAAADAEKKAKETVEGVLGFVENRVFAAARPKGLAGGLGYDVRLADAMTAALPSIKKDFPDKPLVEARLRETIGISFLSLGKPQIAVGQFELARSLHGRHLGPDHPETLRSTANLATSYAALGRHAEALKLREQTLAMRKARLGPDHPDRLRSMARLATSYAALGRHAEALKLREETLALSEARLGPDHLETLGSMANLATSYADLGRHAEALKLREETLAMRKARLGPDHPDTLGSMANLATSYADLGRHAEALKLREETLAMRKARLGPDHPDTLGSMANLATSYAALGRHAEALKLREETLALRKARLGPDHPDTLRSMARVANSYAALGRHAEALKLREETLALRKARLGPDHPDTLTSMNNLAGALMAAGRTPEALPLLEKSSASDPRDMLASLRVAALRAWLGQEEEFGAVRRRALALARGTDDVVLAGRVAKLSSILPAPDRAELDAALALGRTAAKPGDEAPYRPYRLLALGMAAYRAGDDPACDAALLAAGEASKDIPAVTITSAFYRAMSLHRRGRTDEARKLATEAAATMKPLPADARNPLAGGADHDDLILWLAYKEAKALIQFDGPPAAPAPAEPEGKPIR